MNELPAMNRRHWLSEAVSFALSVPAHQTRKGTDIPYISHLLGVASLVLEHGGDEEQAMAALLHDAIEDQGAHQAPIIAAYFGPRVAAIVQGCTDTDRWPTPPWRARKQAYIDHLQHADPDILLVSCADKLHNARAICSDLRAHGSAVYERFRGGREGTLWYYERLSEAFSRLLPGPLAANLAEAVKEMRWLSASGLSPCGTDYRFGYHGPERNQTFARLLADQCLWGAEASQSRLVDEVRTLAQNHELTYVPEDMEVRNLWEDFAWDSFQSEMPLHELDDNYMRDLCRRAIDAMPVLEREILSRCTKTYSETWSPEDPEPDEAERLKWLVEDVYRQVYEEAYQYGRRMYSREEETGDEEGGNEPGDQT